jgi:hypothetical protein
MVSRTTYLRRWGEKKVQFRKVKKDRGPRKKSDFWRFISLLYKQRETMGWDMQKNRETPFPSFSLFLLHCG